MTFSKLPLAIAASTVVLFLAAVDCGNLDEFGQPTSTSGSTTSSTSQTTGGMAGAATTATTSAATTSTGGTGGSGTTTTTAATTGTTGGSGGSGGSGGTGGSAGSAGKATDGGSSDGGKTDGGVVTGDGGATFAQVRSLLTMNCAVTGCHGNAGGQMHVDLRDTTGLYTRITGQAPATAPTACKGKALITPSSVTMSFLISMVDTNTAARMSCGARMPDGCPTNRQCLTTQQIQMLKDWVTAGAPMQ